MISTAVWMYLVGTGQIEYSWLWIATFIFDSLMANSIGGIHVKR